MSGSQRYIHSGLKIKRFDHLVLTVKNIPKTIDFYSKVLGMEEVSFKVQISSYIALEVAVIPLLCQQFIHAISPQI